MERGEEGVGDHRRKNSITQEEFVSIDANSFPMHQGGTQTHARTHARTLTGCESQVSRNRLRRNIACIRDDTREAAKLCSRSHHFRAELYSFGSFAFAPFLKHHASEALPRFLRSLRVVFWRNGAKRERENTGGGGRHQKMCGRKAPLKYVYYWTFTIQVQSLLINFHS